MKQHYIYLKVQRDGIDQDWGYYNLCKIEGLVNDYVDDNKDERLQAVIKAFERDKNNMLKSISGRGLGPQDKAEIEVKTLRL